MSEMTLDTEFLTPEVVAEKLQLNTVTIRRLCSSRKIAAVKVAGQWRIPVDAYLSYLTDSEPPAGVARPRRVEQPRSRWHLTAIGGGKA